jgi:hypothetical protein
VMNWIKSLFGLRPPRDEPDCRFPSEMAIISVKDGESVQADRRKVWVIAGSSEGLLDAFELFGAPQFEYY